MCLDGKEDVAGKKFEVWILPWIISVVPYSDKEILKMDSGRSEPIIRHMREEVGVWD